MIDIREKLTQLLIRIFKPLVRILLRHGISYKATAEVLKWCYVDIAHKEFGINNKKANKSRVAVITGLTWIDVKNLIDNDVALMDVKPEQFHRASRVLTGWLTDKNYLQDGQAKIIPINSDSNNQINISFENLVENYSGGATIRSILDDLIEHKAVEKTANDQVKLLRTHYISSSNKSEEQAIDIMAMSVSDLINTINHNIKAEDDDLYFQRIVQQRQVPKKHLPLIHTFIRERSQKLADEVDNFIGALSHQESTDCSENKLDRLGLGIYYYQDYTNSEKETNERKT
ncbi:MAG: hypothetical protein JKY19_08365 [Alcanivoracaceae bacterium]|nr:hypothetical protein [Alcanivoracaceae bacterium]